MFAERMPFFAERAVKGNFYRNGAWKNFRKTDPWLSFPKFKPIF